MSASSGSGTGRAKLRWWLKWTGLLLLLSGFAALAWCGFLWVRAWNFQRQAKAYLTQVLESHPARLAPVSRFRNENVLGRIDIPRVGVSSVVLQSDNEASLQLGVGHIPGTALPGGDGNVALAGHRDTFFRGLKDIRKNDEILLTTPDGTYLYQVAWTRIVPPEDVGVLKDTGKPLLTLVTCYPFEYIGAAPDRFVVRAARIGPR